MPGRARRGVYRNGRSERWSRRRRCHGSIDLPTSIEGRGDCKHLSLTADRAQALGRSWDLRPRLQITGNPINCTSCLLPQFTFERVEQKPHQHDSSSGSNDNAAARFPALRSLGFSPVDPPFSDFSDISEPEMLAVCFSFSFLAASRASLA